MMMKAMMSSQLKDLPEEQKEMIITLVEKNPEFFQKMATQIKERVDRGEDQMMAMQAVAKENQEELKQIFMDIQKEERKNAE